MLQDPRTAYEEMRARCPLARVTPLEEEGDWVPRALVFPGDGVPVQACHLAGGRRPTGAGRPPIGVARHSWSGEVALNCQPKERPRVRSRGGLWRDDSKRSCIDIVAD